LWRNKTCLEALEIGVNFVAMYSGWDYCVMKNEISLDLYFQDLGNIQNHKDMGQSKTFKSPYQPVARSKYNSNVVGDQIMIMEVQA
jgi:hypothetical protein